MEVDGDSSSAGTQDGLTARRSIDQRESSRGLNDIMIRRLKNRERQRRYRARKRMLEADNMTDSRILNQSFTTRQAEPQLNHNVEKFVTRVYCKRDWKKDARRAYLNNVQDDTIDSSVNLPPTATIAIDYAEVPADPDKCEMQKSKASRRDWKAEARNKKN